MNRIKLIKTSQDHQEALARIEMLLSADMTPQEEDELELLAHLVDYYEDVQFPIEMPSPVAAIRFHMQQFGLKQKDLVEYIGSKSKVSEILSEKRSLTLQMMRKLHEGLGIPADILLQQPEATFPVKEAPSPRLSTNSPSTRKHLPPRRTCQPRCSR